MSRVEGSTVFPGRHGYGILVVTTAGKNYSSVRSSESSRSDLWGLCDQWETG